MQAQESLPTTFMPVGTGNPVFGQAFDTQNNQLQGNIFKPRAQQPNVDNNIFNAFAQNAGVGGADDEDDLFEAAPIPMHVTRRRKEHNEDKTNIPLSDDNLSKDNIKTNIKSNDIQKTDNEQVPTQQQVYDTMEKPRAQDVPIYTPPLMTPNRHNIDDYRMQKNRDELAEKRKSNNTWQTVLLVVASILLIGALVLAVLYALGFFKKHDQGVDGCDNDVKQDDVKIDDNKVPVNDNKIPLDNIPNDNNPRIDASDTIDGRYDSGVLSGSVDSSINQGHWDGIGQSNGLLTNGDINYTKRFQEIVGCENSPNVTYTLWKDMNGDGVCQTNEIIAKGKGFEVDGNCAIINGRKFQLTDDMQAFSKLHKLSNQELKVLNHTSTYWKNGEPHVIIDGLKTSVNIDDNHVGGVLNIDGYNIGDFSTTDISKNAFAKDIINSYLKNNNLTEAQQKLIASWATGLSSANVKQMMEHYMNNLSATNNLKDTHLGQNRTV